MQRKFNIKMRVPIGIRCGVLTFEEDGTALRGTFEALGSSDSFTGTVDSDGNIEFTGRMPSLFHTFSYLAKGKIEGTSLELTVTGNRYRFCVTGDEIQK